jgi:hypothetical protein
MAGLSNQQASVRSLTRVDVATFASLTVVDAWAVELPRRSAARSVVGGGGTAMGGGGLRSEVIDTAVVTSSFFKDRREASTLGESPETRRRRESSRHGSQMVREARADRRDHTGPGTYDPRK